MRWLMQQDFANRQLLQIGALISGIGLVASYLLAMLLWQIGFF